MSRRYDIKCIEHMKRAINTEDRVIGTERNRHCRTYLTGFWNPFQYQTTFLERERHLGLTSTSDSEAIFETTRSFLTICQSTCFVDIVTYESFACDNDYYVFHPNQTTDTSIIYPAITYHRCQNHSLSTTGLYHSLLTATRSGRSLSPHNSTEQRISNI